MRTRSAVILVSMLGVSSSSGPVAAWQDTRLEVDHLFLAVAPKAPEARALVEAGFMLIPDTSVHVGQGTASVAAIFANAYLELIWLEGEEDPLGMGQRVAWRQTGASPIGIGLRRVDTLAVGLPFKTRSYSAPWMLPGTAIEIADAGEEYASDPEIFIVPPYMSWPVVVRQLGRPPPQPLGVHNVTHITVVRPGGGERSEAVRVLQDAGIVEFRSGAEHRLDLVFDDGAQGRRIDLRPGLPLVIEY